MKGVTISNWELPQWYSTIFRYSGSKIDSCYGTWFRWAVASAIVIYFDPGVYIYAKWILRVRTRPMSLSIGSWIYCGTLGAKNGFWGLFEELFHLRAGGRRARSQRGGLCLVGIPQNLWIFWKPDVGKWYVVQNIYQVIQSDLLIPIVGGHLTFQRVTSPSQK